MKVIYPALTSVVRDHWNAQLQQAAFKLQKWTEKLNPSAASELRAMPQTDQYSEPVKGSAWDRLIQLEKQETTEKPKVSKKKAANKKLDAETSKLLSKHGLLLKTNTFGTELRSKENLQNPL